VTGPERDAGRRLEHVASPLRLHHGPGLEPGDPGRSDGPGTRRWSPGRRPEDEGQTAQTTRGRRVDPEPEWNGPGAPRYRVGALLEAKPDRVRQGARLSGSAGNAASGGSTPGGSTGTGAASAGVGSVCPDVGPATPSGNRAPRSRIPATSRPGLHQHGR
jgi:hypothetical protein